MKATLKNGVVIEGTPEELKTLLGFDDYGNEATTKKPEQNIVTTMKPVKVFIRKHEPKTLDDIEKSSGREWKHWTEYEDSVLINGVKNGVRRSKIASSLNRTVCAVYRRLSVLRAEGVAPAKATRVKPAEKRDKQRSRMLFIRGRMKSLIASYGYDYEKAFRMASDEWNAARSRHGAKSERERWKKNPRETEGFAACDECAGGEMSSLNGDDLSTYTDGKTTLCTYHLMAHLKALRLARGEQR